MTIHGKNTGVAAGPFDLTRWLNEVSSDSSIETADVSCFDEPQGAKVYVAGLRDTTFSFSGREQGTINGPRQAIGGFADLEISAPFTVAIDRGFHPGRIAQIGEVLSTGLNLSAPVADVVSVSGDLQADGAVEMARILTRKEPYETTTTGAQIQVAGGLSARIHYHVVANTANGEITITVQHSEDGAVWVDYDQVAVGIGEVIGVASVVPDALDSYARVVVSMAGSTGSATVRVAIARRV